MFIFANGRRRGSKDWLFFCGRYEWMTPNRIDKRLMLKIKDGYKVELQTPETMKLFGSAKKVIDKTKIGEKLSNLEVV